MRVASVVKEAAHRDHVVRSRRKPKVSVSRADRVGCQVGGPVGDATRRWAPLSDMDRMGLLAVAFLIKETGARSMSELAEIVSPEGGSVTCHTCRRALDAERDMRVESWYQ